MAAYTFVANGTTKLVYGKNGKWFVRPWPYSQGDEVLSGPHPTRKAAVAYHNSRAEL
jgi:hypothetical protein